PPLEPSRPPALAGKRLGAPPAPPGADLPAPTGISELRSHLDRAAAHFPDKLFPTPIEHRRLRRRVRNAKSAARGICPFCWRSGRVAGWGGGGGPTRFPPSAGRRSLVRGSGGRVTALGSRSGDRCLPA